MPSIRAIPTAYEGISFRSRLEARWAVFFDQLKIRWEYEPEGFQLPNGERYLPDFWLPDLGCYCEVKPIGGDVAKATYFATVIGRVLWICEGPPRTGWFRFVSAPWHSGQYSSSKRRLWWGFGEEVCHDGTDDPKVARAAIAARNARFGA